MELKIKKLSKDAIVPTMSYTDIEAGLDFYSSEDKVILPNTKELVGTGVAIEVPGLLRMSVEENKVCVPMKHYLKLYSRSGLSAKKGIEVGAGVIDSSYRGEVKVVMFNHGFEVLEVKRDDKIAQGVLYMIPCYNIAEVDELSETPRGDKGFGSSDKKI